MFRGRVSSVLFGVKVNKTMERTIRPEAFELLISNGHRSAVTTSLGTLTLVLADHRASWALLSGNNR